MHYNVQSILSKLEILHAELIEFGVLAFSETWLNASTETDDLLLESYSAPVRKDRIGDSHRGLILYIKNGIYFKRRDNLEIRGIESLWIEISNNRKHILFGPVYRPPNSNRDYFSNIEDSIALALDTGKTDIIITSNFNYKLLNPVSSRKIDSLCPEFPLFQSINQSTHFTENSSSLIDILIVSNKDYLILSGVGDPFLNQQIRYTTAPFMEFSNFQNQKINHSSDTYGTMLKKITTFFEIMQF